MHPKVNKRQIFRGRISYQVGPLPAELGQLASPKQQTKQSRRRGGDLSTASKFRKMILDGGPTRAG